MRAGDDFDKVTECAKEYVRLKRDDVKLQCVESLSIIASDIFSALIIVFLSAIALVFVILAIMLLIAKFIGFLYGSLVVGGAMLAIAYIVYLFRKELFANIFLRKLCRLFFNEITPNEKE